MSILANLLVGEVYLALPDPDRGPNVRPEAAVFDLLVADLIDRAGERRLHALALLRDDGAEHPVQAGLRVAARQAVEISSMSRDHATDPVRRFLSQPEPARHAEPVGVEVVAAQGRLPALGRGPSSHAGDPSAGGPA